MTFLTNLTKNKKGVTLLLAILVLSAILAISFSLTTIIFIEVRSSGDLFKSEGALYGATGVAEQALFNLKRKVCISNELSCYSSQFTNNVKLVGNPYLTSTSSPTFTDKVLTTSNTISNTKNKYDFCSNALVYNGSKLAGCGYGKVTVSYVSTGHDGDSVFVYLCEFDQNAASGTYNSEPCTNLTDSYWKTPTEVQLTGISSITVSWNLDKDLQQQLILKNCDKTGQSCSQNPVYFSVTTYDIDNATPKGLPLQGKSSIIVNTQNGSVGRKVQVIVPSE